jgi:predicted DNA-binding ribbon-helix-helix protein
MYVLKRQVAMDDMPAFELSSARQKSPVQKRSVRVNGRRTSVSLEGEFYDAFKDIASLHQCSVDDLAPQVDKDRHADNLSSAIRLFVLRFYRKPPI